MGKGVSHLSDRCQILPTSIVNKTECVGYSDTRVKVTKRRGVLVKELAAIFRG